MLVTDITVSDFKSFFVRDFPFAPTQDSIYIKDYILDTDIQKAFDEAQIAFNYNLFDNDTEIKVGYLYLVAHNLVMDLQASLKGLGSAGYNIVNSKSIGSISESYSIPDEYLRNPIYTPYTKTHYGLKYLSIVLPRMVGLVSVVYGGTNA